MKPKQIYKFLAAEAVMRLLRRGQPLDVAVSTAAFLLGLAMAANITSVICLLGVQMPGQKSFYFAAAISLIFSTDFLNRKLIKESLRGSMEELYSCARSNERIGLWSATYILGSILLGFIVVAITWGKLLERI
jgi:hypothetical protein